MARLIQKTAGGSLSKEWPLTDQPLRIGRGDKVDVTVVDGEMSREHFAIIPREGVHVIQDLNSKNGTFVNGERITERMLQAEDQVRAGQTTFVYVADKPKGLKTIINELERESQSTGKGFSTIRRDLYKKV